ncbi:MAG: cysteine desulfurase-like protein [Planctomycetaceae bacterium]|nr:cysteine desulfurase-like protein [Planctomycetaceae bacterium]
MTPLDVEWVREQFPGLSHRQDGQSVAFFDGPAGSQVTRSVGDAVRRYLLETNSQHGGVFEVSRTSDGILEEAHRAFADFLGADNPDCIVFGANMTTITLAVSRALAQTWSPGDDIIVTRLDHEGNVSPWVLAARDAGAVIRRVDVNIEDGTLNQASYRSLLSPKTKLVAIGLASNITGTINPVREMIRQAHDVGAMVYVDAVHYAPHELIDVADLNADFLVCSAYKFFGPHLGVLYGRRELLEEIQPYKLRVATNELPGKWMTGTACHEGIAGALACVEYLASLGRHANPAATSRREAICFAFAAIQNHEQQLARRMLEGLQNLGAYRLWGIADIARIDERVPTFSLTYAKQTPLQLATRLAEVGCYAWAGNHYALSFSEAADLEPHGTLRIGLLHYNTSEEVDRVLAELDRLA